MAVVMMCGLPASGKTTTAGRLHAHAGGVLIRSCDVYADLGIRLPDWVERTAGFTVDVQEYDQVRDRAYEEIARRLERNVESRLVILDAVYGERAKRRVIYTIAHARGVDVSLIHCRCDDATEIARRFEARRGREAIPEHEASDRAVFRDIARRWEDPHADRLANGCLPVIVTVDTLAEPPRVAGDSATWLLAPLREALSTLPPVSSRRTPASAG